MMLVVSDIWLKPILYMTRLYSLLRPGGTEPVNRLLDILMLSILVTLWRDGGIGPLNLLKQLRNTRRFGSRKPMSLGISP